MKLVRMLFWIAAAMCAQMAIAQEIPYFTSNVPPEEFARAIPLGA